MVSGEGRSKQPKKINRKSSSQSRNFWGKIKVDDDKKHDDGISVHPKQAFCMSCSLFF